MLRFSGMSRQGVTKVELTVFYAWQSDQPAKCNRYFIRDAAKDACRRISNDESFGHNVVLDSDTQGVAGMCDIPNTILEKIKKCDAFLVDLTFVGRTDEIDPDTNQQSPMSNANALFELGYAAAKRGFDRAIGVTNECFGKWQGQAFDIKKRASISYHLSPDADKAERQSVKKSLSSELEHAMRVILDEVLIEKGMSQPDFDEIRGEFEYRVKSKEFHLIRELPALAITLVPVASPGKLQHDDIQKCVSKTFRSHINRARSVAYSNEYTAVEVDVEGRLFAASKQSLKLCGDVGIQMVHPPNTRGFIATGSFYRDLVSLLQNCFQLMAALDIKQPWRFSMSLIGITRFVMGLRGGRFSRIYDQADGIYTDPILISSVDKDIELEEVAELIRGPMDYVFREFGYDKCWLYD